MAHVNHTNSSGVTSPLHNYPVDFNSNPLPLSLFLYLPSFSRFTLINYFPQLPSVV